MSTLYLPLDFEVVTCGADGCAEVFAMIRRTASETRRTGRTWYCPSGHPRVWGGPTTEQRLRDAEARETHLSDQLRAAEADAEAARVASARLLQRVAFGVCPCCHRSFGNLRRHVETQHPDLTAEQRTALAETPKFTCSCRRSFGTLHGLRVHQGRSRDDRWTDPKVDAWYRHLTLAAP